MFRRPTPSPPRVVPPESHEARLRALGYLLDQRGYDQHGLCILEAEGGFEINGLPPRLGPPAVDQQSTYFTADELRAAIAALQAMP